MKTPKRKLVSEDRLTIATRRRIRRSVKGNENSQPPIIPIDVIITIFSKLPLKSIARCRCVSKLWASILRRSDFTELFFSTSFTRGPKVLFGFRNQSEFFTFSSPQPQNPIEDLSSVIVPKNHMKFSFSGDCRAGDLVHGLLCLEHLGILKICNPSTGQTLILSEDVQSWCSLLGYDPIGKQHKVLTMRKRCHNSFVCDEFQVLTLGKRGQMSWKTIECCIPHNPPRRKICINGVIYYTPIHWLTDTFPIVCFDVRSEKFSFISTTEIISFLKTPKIISLLKIPPSGVFNEAECGITLINYNGKLCFLVCEDGIMFEHLYGESIKFKLWVLEDVGNQVWSCRDFVFPTENVAIESGFLTFVGITQTNEIVLTPSSSYYPFNLLYLNLEKKTIVQVTIEGDDAFVDDKYGVEHIFLNHVENVEFYGAV